MIHRRIPPMVVDLSTRHGLRVHGNRLIAKGSQLI